MNPDLLDDGVEPAVVIEDAETWAKVPEALAYDTEISDKAVRVFICLYRHGIDPSRCYPSDERIAKLIGCSPKSVPRARMQLMEKGWVRRFPRRTASGMRAANGHALALDPARARRQAAEFVRGAEPEALKKGREAKFAQESADGEVRAGERGPFAQESADVRAGEREEREPGKESKRKTTPLPLVTPSAPSALPGMDSARSARQAKRGRNQIDRHLDAFLAMYPHEATEDTEPAIRAALTRAVKRARAADILEGLAPWVAHWERNPRYIPRPTNWLARDQWTKPPVQRGPAPVAPPAPLPEVLDEPAGPPPTEAERQAAVEHFRATRRRYNLLDEELSLNGAAS